MSKINLSPFTTRPEIDGTFGVVTSTHWITTAVGMAILEKGGNAFDAAVATAFTLQAVEPHLNGPGGDQQDQWTTQFFLRHVHSGMKLQEAIDAPAWHSEHFPISFWPRTARPGVLVVESRVSKTTVAELERRGHTVKVGPAWSEGRLTAASREGRRRRAAANPRSMQGYAAGR